MSSEAFREYFPIASDTKLVKISVDHPGLQLFTVLCEDIIYLVTSMEPHHLLSYHVTLLLLLNRNMMLQKKHGQKEMIVLLYIISSVDPSLHARLCKFEYATAM